MSLSVVILGAGKGTRMKSSTPKILHRVANHSMISTIIRVAEKVSTDITVVTAHQADRVEKHIAEKFPSVKFLRQDSENYPGTAGALWGYQPDSNRVLVLNGDMPLIDEVEIEELLSTDADAVLTAFNLEDPTGYGRVIENGDGSVIGIVEQKDATEEQKAITLVNGGVYLFSRDLLEGYLHTINNSNNSKEYYLTDLISIAVENSFKVRSAKVNRESFMGVNSQKQLSTAEEILLRRIRDRAMDSGVTMSLPETIFIDPDVEFSGDCKIEQNVTIIGKSVITDSHIKAGTVIDNSTIKSSTIGVMAHIRPDSTITDSKVGNFVEVKKSTLNGVKSGHLSYIGDSDIDEGTNIGAGVITCNYDGKSKHQTKIGKNVFVGSDSQLVAPLNISDDTMIGAGSTITADVPKGSLAISRIKMKIVNGFFYKFFGK